MNEKEVIDLTNKIITQLLYSKVGVGVDWDDYFSESFFWLANPGRINKIINLKPEVQKEERVLLAAKYIRSSLIKLFNKIIVDQKIKNLTEISFFEYYEEVKDYGNSKDYRNNAVGFGHFFDILKNNSEMFLESEELVKYLSVFQKEAISLSYLNGLSDRAAGELLGISTKAFYDRRIKGEKNLFIAFRKEMIGRNNINPKEKKEIKC